MTTSPKYWSAGINETLGNENGANHSPSASNPALVAPQAESQKLLLRQTAWGTTETKIRIGAMDGPGDSKHQKGFACPLCQSKKLASSQWRIRLIHILPRLKGIRTEIPIPFLPKMKNETL